MSHIIAIGYCALPEVPLLEIWSPRGTMSAATGLLRKVLLSGFDSDAGLTLPELSLL